MENCSVINLKVKKTNTVDNAVDGSLTSGVAVKLIFHNISRSHLAQKHIFQPPTTIIHIPEPPS